MSYQQINHLLYLTKSIPPLEKRSFRYVEQDFHRNKIFFNEQCFKLNEYEPRNSLVQVLQDAKINNPLIMTYIGQEAHQDGFLNTASSALVSLIHEKGYGCRAEMKQCYFNTQGKDRISYTEKAAIFIARHLEEPDIELKVKATIEDIISAKGNPSAFFKIEPTSNDIMRMAQQNMATLLSPDSLQPEIIKAKAQLHFTMAAGQLSILKPLVILEASSTICSTHQSLQHTFNKPTLKLEPTLGIQLVKSEPSLARKLLDTIKCRVNVLLNRFNQWRHKQIAPVPSIAVKMP
jgi:hypothetical protein